MAQDNKQSQFLGKGWQFPPEFSKANRSAIMTENEEDINRSLQVLLTTTPGERILQPRYGCDMKEWLFESMDTATLTIIEDKVRTALLYFEPRIEVTDFKMETNRIVEGMITFHIEYKIRTTNSRYNFVFPYYINEGTEINFTDANKPTLL